RMNNAIYRSGHLQNSITVDVNILEKAEIIFGPGSVVYGSDALGGVIHYRTKTPEISRSGKQEVSVNLSGRLSSVNQEKSSHFDFSIAEGRVASLTSFSVSDFGDLRMGTRRSHGDEQWGLVPEYVSTSGFQDFIIDNPDPTIQRGTGYQQMDFLQKLIYAPNDSLSFMVNFQFSTSSHVPRFDRLNDYRNGTLRWAEWSYGPQRRVLFSVGAKYQNRTAFFDELNVAAAVQDIEESRYKRLVNSTVRNAQIESVGVYSVNMDLVKQWKAKTQLNYGLEFVHNDVTSEATDRNLETLEVTSAFTRYPDEGSTMTTAAAYAMVKHELNKKFNLQAGTRYTLANLQSSYSNQEFFQLPFDEIQLSNGAFTGSLGLIWTPDSTIQVNAILASAFRIPNVDDFGKVRENGGFVIVPNDDLVPEQVYTAELNASKSFFENRFRIAAGGFYSIYNDALVARSGTLNGQDSLFIEGAMAKIEKNVNTNRAILYGGFAEVEVAIIAGFSAKGTVNYTYGQDVTDDIPLAHIPPVFGRASLEYLKEKFRGELFAQFNGAKDIDRYAPGVTDKAEEALETGTPSWYTINFSSSYYISKTLEAQFGVTNILDEHYKVFSSGPSAPGRNIYLGLRASF
ncbi:MAG: TonB-dependent receptor, partial [Flavobacteriales bacterium]|nr:TonB-dependent receptor [Flavobacteriales bacterium]